jgi:hypothetical protein
MILRNFQPAEDDLENDDNFAFYGNSLNTMLIDKIGIKIPTKYLVKERCALFSKGFITILHWGNTSQINIHPEYLPHIPNHLERVFFALNQLNYFNCFDMPDETYFVPLDILKKYCKLGELEIALDFVGYKPTIQFSDDCFICFRGTFYSRRDYKQTRRVRDGKYLSKGMQHSFITYYNKGKLLGIGYPYYRLELRFQGKYAKDLNNFAIINGSTSNIYQNCRRRMIINCNNILSEGSIAFSYAEMPKYPMYFNIFAKDIDNLAKPV